MSGKKKKKKKKKIIWAALSPILMTLLFIIVIGASINMLKQKLIDCYNVAVGMIATLGEDDQHYEIYLRFADGEPLEDFSSAELAWILEELNAIVDADLSELETGLFKREDLVKILNAVAAYENDSSIYGFFYETDYLRTMTDMEVMEAYKEAYQNVLAEKERTSTSEWQKNFQELDDLMSLYESWTEDTEDIHADNYNMIFYLTQWWKDHAEELHYDPIGEWIIENDWEETDSETETPIKQFYDKSKVLSKAHYYNEVFAFSSSAYTAAVLTRTEDIRTFAPYAPIGGDEDKYRYVYSYQMQSSSGVTHLSYYKDIYKNYAVTWQYVYAGCALHAIQRGAISSSSNDGLELELDENFLDSLVKELCSMQTLTAYDGNSIEAVRSRLSNSEEYGDAWLRGYFTRRDNPLSFQATAYYTHSGGTEITYKGEGYASVRDITPTYALHTFHSLYCDISTELTPDGQTVISESITTDPSLLDAALSKCFEEYDESFSRGMYQMILKNLPGGEACEEKMGQGRTITERSVNEGDFDAVYFASEFPDVNSDITIAERPDFCPNVVLPDKGQYIPTMDVVFFDINATNEYGQTSFCEKKDLKQMQLYILQAYGVSAVGQAVSLQNEFDNLNGYVSGTQYAARIPLANRIASTGRVYFQTEQGEEYPAYMRTLSADEIDAIMERTGLTGPDTAFSQNYNYDIAHMYEIVKTALNSVGKIQYLPEGKRDDDGNHGTNITGENAWGTTWRTDATGMYIWLQTYGFYPALSYPVSDYTTYVLDKYVWSETDIETDYNRLPEPSEGQVSPVYTASDMGYLLWLYESAGRDAIEGYYMNSTTARMFLTEYVFGTDDTDLGMYSFGVSSSLKPKEDDHTYQHITYKGRYDYNESLEGESSNLLDDIKDWCVGDIIIEVKNERRSIFNGSSEQILDADDENIHAFMYLGPTNSTYTQFALVECYGDPTYSLFDVDTKNKLLGGTMYSVLDYKLEAEDGAVFYRFSVTLNQNPDYIIVGDDYSDETEHLRGQY